MQIIDIINAVILGIIQGITEWLPISSTGHMILVDEFLKMNMTKSFMDMFFVVIQLGSILAVAVLYFNKLNPFASNKRRREKEDTMVLWFKVVVAAVPAGIVGVLFDDKINEIFYNYWIVALMLIIYGVLFIIFENRNQYRKSRITKLSQLDYSTALLIGVFQVLALIPGTSRSGATILGAVMIGCSRYVAAEFSFFLAIPMMFGASLLKIIKLGFDFTGAELAILLTGTIVAFFVSIFAIKFLMEYIKKHDFKAFGYYRIILGALVLLYFNFFHTVS